MDPTHPVTQLLQILCLHTIQHRLTWPLLDKLQFELGERLLATASPMPPARQAAISFAEAMALMTGSRTTPCFRKTSTKVSLVSLLGHIGPHVAMSQHQSAVPLQLCLTCCASGTAFTRELHEFALQPGFPKKNAQNLTCGKNNNAPIKPMPSLSSVFPESV